MEGERKSVNSELWHACAGPRVCLPSVGSLVVYFPQGHSEQVAASTQRDVDGHIPNYPNLQSQLICQLHSIALHADTETDEVFAQMTLKPVNEQEEELFLSPDIGIQNRQPTEFFCKTLTASDTSTHGGFSVPRRAAEKVFPPLDHSKQPPAQELRARDLHDQIWTFRHIYRGQPKRHLLTTGWSVFVNAKRLVAGDSVLFIRDDKGQLLLGIRRANHQQTILSSSVLSSDSMHIGVLAAAAHAAATNSRFQVFYNPRTSPSEFVIPLVKYRKALYCSQVSLGTRFRMVFETEDCTLRRYMGTIARIGDLDPECWPGSKWRNLEVGWDESSVGDRPRRVSIWEIEPVSSPFFICPSAFSLRTKRSFQPGFLGSECDMDGSLKRFSTRFQGENDTGHLSCSPFQSLQADASWMPVQENGGSFYMPEALQEIRNIHVSKLLQQPNQQRDMRLLQGAQPSLQPVKQHSHAMCPQYNGGLSGMSSQHQPYPMTLHSQDPYSQPQSQSQACTSSSTPPQTYPHSYELPELESERKSQIMPIRNPQSETHSFTYPQFPVPTPLNLQKGWHIQAQEHPKPQSHLITQSQMQAIPQPQPHPAQLHSQPQSQSEVQINRCIQTASQSSLCGSASELMSYTSSLHSSASNQQLQTTHQQQHQNPHLPAQAASWPEVQQSLLEGERQALNVSSDSSSYGQFQTFHSKQSSAFCEPDLVLEGKPASGYSPFQLQGVLNRSNSVLSTSSNTLGFNGFNQVMHIERQSQQGQCTQACQEPSHDSAVTSPQSAITTQQSSKQQPEMQDKGVLSSTSLPPLGTQFMTASWYTTQCESPLLSNALSNAPIGQSETSSTITSCSFSVPPEQLDNSVIVPPNMGARSLELGNSNKDLQGMVMDVTMVGSFPSAADSFTSEGFPNTCTNSGMIVNRGLEGAILPPSGWGQVAAPLRTFTKVHKSGSVGRSIDLSRLKGYDELRCELARMFNLEGHLEDPQKSRWQLVFVDHDGDILLVGDDPWDEFVSCVRAIKILSPLQVLQMNQEGLEQLSTLPI